MVGSKLTEKLITAKVGSKLTCVFLMCAHALCLWMRAYIIIYNQINFDKWFWLAIDGPINKSFWIWDEFSCVISQKYTSSKYIKYIY